MGLSLLTLEEARGQAKLRDPLEVNIRDYHLDAGGTTDVSDLLQAAGTAASAIGVAAGRPVTIGGFRAGVYRIDDNIPLYDMVRWRLDDARIIAGVDLPTSGMFRAVETLTGATAIGAGTTVNGSYIVTSVANVASWRKEDRVTGTGIPADTKIAHVDVANSRLILDAAATASGTVTLTRAATYYYSCRQAGLIGGVLDPNGKAVGANVRAMFTTDLLIEGTEAVHNRKTGDDNYAFQLGGRDCLAKWPKVTGGSKVFQDGFHWMHGQRLQLIGGDFQSGDDAIALAAISADTYLSTQPDPIRDIAIGDCQVRSSHAYGLTVWVDNGVTGRDWEITNVSVGSITGTAGTLRNGGIRVIDNNVAAVGTSQIDGVHIGRVELDVGSKGHDDATAANMAGVYLKQARNVSIGAARLKLTDGVGAATGLHGMYIDRCDGVTIENYSNASAGINYLLEARTSKTVRLRNSNLSAGSTVGHVYVSSVTDIEIDNNNFQNVPTGQFGVTISASGANQVTTGVISRNRFHNASGSGVGIICDADDLQRLLVADNDFTEVAEAISTYNVARLGQSTTATATATASGTTLTVADSAVFLANDTIYNVRTREWMKVSTVTDATHIEAVRARRGSTGVAVASGDVLKVFRLITRGNWPLANYDPFEALDRSSGQKGATVLPPGFVGQITTTAGSSNNGRIVRFKPDHDMVVTKIGFGVQAWTAGDTADPAMSAAIYDAAWARLGTTGATSGKLNGIGVKEATLGSPVTMLTGQIYYVGLSVGALGTSTVTLSGVSAASNQARDGLGTDAGFIQLDSASTVHPLPDPWVAGGTSSSAFLLWVLEQ